MSSVHTMCRFKHSPPVFAALAGAVVMGPGAIVVGTAMVVQGGGVAMVMDAHGRPILQNVTSARCTQPESLAGKNCRVITA